MVQKIGFDPEAKLEMKSSIIAAAQTMGKELVEKKFSDQNMYLYHGLGAYGAEGWEAVVNIAGLAPLVAFLGSLEKLYSEDQRAGEKRGGFLKSILSSNQRPESKTVTELLITNMDCILYQT